MRARALGRRVDGERLVTVLLGELARTVLDEPAGDAAVARLLGEVLRALHVQDALSRGDRLPDGEPAALSPGAFALAVRLAAAKQHYEGAGSPRPPNALPAGLEATGGAVAGDLQARASSVADWITLEEAAVLLGRSSERARQLAVKGKLAGWQEQGGRGTWHVSRSSVVAYRDGGNGNHGPGGGERPAA